VEPRNFLLEVWASYGVLALLGVLGALGVFFWKVLRPSRETPPASEGPAPTPAPKNPAADAAGSPSGAGASPAPEEAPRWEFYFGGVAGLLLAYLLRQDIQSPEDVLGGLHSPDDQVVEAALAVGRGVV